MNNSFSPERWANALTVLLNSTYGDGPDRFPVRVGQLAKEYSHCARESPGEEDGIERRWHTLKPFIAS